jgi:hypothetical protein
MNSQNVGPTNAQRSASGHLDRVMQPEQFMQVLDAILSGKYSWACVLILRFAGYNPLHYIPYRTYNRIVKDNHTSGSPSGSPSSKGSPQSTSSHGSGLKIVRDLNYLEDQVPTCSAQVKGGARVGWGMNWWPW